MGSLTDRLRAGAFGAIDKLPGKLGDVAKKANERTRRSGARSPTQTSSRIGARSRHAPRAAR
jgi:hypothetical protein